MRSHGTGAFAPLRPAPRLRPALPVPVLLLLAACSGSPTKENAAPRVAISAPADNSVVDLGTSVTFTGSASDPEDGALTGSALVWTSSLDGPIGTGASFSRSDLSGGSHTVTLTATDSDGKVSTATVSLVVAAPVEFENWVLPLAYQGTAYSASIQVSGGVGTYSYEISDGALPTGMSLNGTNGAITGSSTEAGVHHFQVEVTSGLSVGTRVYSITVSTVAQGAYNVQVANVADEIPSAAAQAALDEAVAKWEAVITGDIVGTLTPIFSESACIGQGSKVPGGTSVDDLLVLAYIGPIDGFGKTLGRATPCGVAGALPRIVTVGALEFDEVDIAVLDAGQLRATFFHEIGHIVGVGTIWNFDRTLLVGHDPTGEDTNADPRFVGTAAIAAYDALGGPDDDIPVENQGGLGTANSHWRESIFQTEIMTGYVSVAGVPNPLSAMTIASVADLGYTVDMEAADPYVLPGGGGLRLAGGEPGLDLGNDVVVEPLFYVAPDGTTRRLEPPR